MLSVTEERTQNKIIHDFVENQTHDSALVSARLQLLHWGDCYKSASRLTHMAVNVSVQFEGRFHLDIIGLSPEGWEDTVVVDDLPPTCSFPTGSHNTCVHILIGFFSACNFVPVQLPWAKVPRYDRT